MLLLGIDLGTSSVKVSVFDSFTKEAVVSVQYPETETTISSPHPGWAEQSPQMWFDHVEKAILKANATQKYSPSDIGAIGIAYQMHGLVVVDKDQQVLRDAIIWCDSRAVETGNAAFSTIGQQRCLTHLLNSPGNFTASKLSWVKQNEPAVYERISKVLLPGDFIALKLTGEATTTISALSEGVFWDFKNEGISQDIISHFDFDRSFIPEVRPVFSVHGEFIPGIARKLGLRGGIPVTYKSGDQPNNALSLNVLNPGDVAATAGTSGVIYGVTDRLTFDPYSRVNTFAHVNHSSDLTRLGVLLCINGTGISNQWVRNNFRPGMEYPEMNAGARQIKIGSDGLQVLPFGNGAERMLNNRIVGAHFKNIDFNIHSHFHIFRAVQEGIACAFRYGLDIMSENGMSPRIIKAGKANLFLSDVFLQAFVNVTNVPVELYENDGSSGAAIGAGIGVGAFLSTAEAFGDYKPVNRVEPDEAAAYNTIYDQWRELLTTQLAAG